MFAIVTMLPTFLLYRYFWANAAFVVGMVTMSIFNGADFYIEVFAKRYRTELQVLDSKGEGNESLFEATFGEAGSRSKSFKDLVKEQPQKKDI
jgi:hypothetical protein